MTKITGEDDDSDNMMMAKKTMGRRGKTTALTTRTKEDNDENGEKDDGYRRLMENGEIVSEKENEDLERRMTTVGGDKK